MRFFVKCDICGKEFRCKKMRLPKKIMLIDGMDLCDECRIEYHKRRRKVIRDLAKESSHKQRKTK